MYSDNKLFWFFNLELHRVGELAVAEGELDTEVLLQQRDLVDGGNEGLVDRVLVSLALSVNGLLLLL